MMLRRILHTTISKGTRGVTSDAKLVSSRIKSSDPKRRELIERILRVDHAGERGAVRIYEGQQFILKGTPAYDKITEMKATEVEHLEDVSRVLASRRARPTAFLPFWDVAGFALGAGTALLGKEAAMACTVAVEEAIGEHYNNQIRELLEKEYPEEDLLKLLQKNRDEELEHLETGLQEGAEQAPFYDGLKQAIKTGCKTAIWVAERFQTTAQQRLQ